MRAPRAAVLLASLLLVVTASAAHADEPWSEPLTLGPPANGSEVTGLGFSARGDGLLSWRLGTSSFIASLRGDGALGPPRRLPAQLAAGPALASGPPLPTPPNGDRAIVFLRGSLPADRTRLRWALVGPGATLGPVHPLRKAKCLSCRVKLAVNWLGEAIAVWSGDGGIHASWRPAGGRFGTPRRLFDGRNGQYPDLTAAIGSDGRAIVVDAGTVVRARVRTRTRGFGPIMRVGRGNGSVRATAAVSNGGQAIVAWGSQDGGEEANEPWVVRAARLSRGARRFAAAQTLDPGTAAARPEGNVALAFTPGGKPTVAWSSVRSRDTFPVMAAAAKHGGRFGAPQKLAPSGAVGAVSVRADGAAVVAWSLLVGSQQPVQVFGSVRPAGAGAFGAPEAIGSPEVGFFPPLVAFDPVSGRPTAGWGSRTGHPLTAADVDNASVRLATRAAP